MNFLFSCAASAIPNSKKKSLRTSAWRNEIASTAARLLKKRSSKRAASSGMW